jgi:hypothetical protein
MKTAASEWPVGVYKTPDDILGAENQKRIFEVIFFWSNYTGAVFGLNSCRHLKELEVLREIVHYVRYDKTGLKPFCFSDLL